MNLGVMAISRDALTLLLTLMNTPRMEAAIDYLKSSGVFEEVMAARLLSPVNVEPTSLYVDGKDRELIRHPEGPGYRYFSEAVGWVDVSPGDIGRFRLNPQRVFALIQGWLDIVGQPQIATLQPEAIWNLGDMWIGKRRLAVLFMRRAHLAASVSHLRQVLEQFPRRRFAMVLTDMAINPHGPELPGNPLMTPLSDLILPDQVEISSVDKTLIAELLWRPTPITRNQDTPIVCSEDGRFLRVHGVDYHFRGVIQPQIIRQLYEAWESGQPRLRTAQVLEQAESKSNTLSQAFGTNDAGETLIGHRDGYCWLKISNEF